MFLLLNKNPNKGFGIGREKKRKGLLGVVIVVDPGHPGSSSLCSLKKKHCTVAYHKARECIAAGIIRIAKEDGKTNMADILTKLVTGVVLRFLVGSCMWRTQTKPSP